MARIRSIKPEVWTDPAFVKCSPLARLLWIGTWNIADDLGVLKDEPDRIRLAILPADDVDAVQLVDELVKAKLLLRKRATDGAAVLVIRTFREHQKIDSRRDGRYGDPDQLADLGTLDEALLSADPVATLGADARHSATARADARRSAPKRDGTRPYDQGRDQGSSLSVDAKTSTKRTKATRVPDPFPVSDAMAAWAVESFPDFDWKRETPRFLDYWRSKSGRDATKADWPATWRNWIRNAAEGKYTR